MGVTGDNILKKEIYPNWIPLLSFGAGRTRTTSDGLHYYPYNCPYVRTLGIRWKNDLGEVVKNDVGYRRNNTYNKYNTQGGYTFEIKFDPTKLTAIWYRYSNVDAILVDTSIMEKLRLLSFREHMINFGDLDLSSSSKFSHLEISSGGSITSVTFHPDAPLKMCYLDSGYPQAVKDACLTQAYNNRNTALDFASTLTNNLINISGYSAGLQYMADELINLGWSIS